MIRILIADDENLIRQALKIYLKVEPDIEIVGTADNGQTALKLIEELNPDIVLMDMEMPTMDGLTATKIISRRFSNTKVLILSSHDSQDYIDKALEAGAQGYLLKTMPAEELAKAIKFIQTGYVQIAPNIPGNLSSSLAKKKSSLNKNNTNLPSDLAPSRTDTEKREQKKIISLNPTSSKLPFSPSNNLQSNQFQPELASLPAANSQEFLPSLNQWINRGGIVLLFFFGAALFLTNVLKYKVTVRADAQIRPTGELRLVQVGVEGKVKSIEVQENQIVAVGETIATISNSQLQTQKQQLQESIQQIQKQLTQVNTQMGELERQIIAEQQTIDRIIASAQVELTLSQREHNDRQIVTQAEVKEAEATAKLAREEWERYQHLADIGAVSRSQISEKKAALEAALARLERSKVSLNPSHANVAKAQEKIAQEKARGTATIATLNREKESLKEKEITLHKQLKRDLQELRQIQNNLHNVVVRAPITGTIQQLNLRNQGQLVRRGDLIAQIAPSQVPLLVKASVASQDIARVENDQTVQLRVFACPYTDFGTLKGKVIAISPDISSPLREENSFISDQEIKSTSGTYEVTIEPVRSFLSGDQQECQLKSGMKARADIVTKEETILTFLLRKARLISDF